MPTSTGLLSCPTPLALFESKTAGILACFVLGFGKQALRIEVNVLHARLVGIGSRNNWLLISVCVCVVSFSGLISKMITFLV